MPTSGERGGGFQWGGGGVNWKCEMMMDDDEMNDFLHSLYNVILRLEDDTVLTFGFTFCS